MLTYCWRPKQHSWKTLIDVSLGVKSLSMGGGWGTGEREVGEDDDTKVIVSAG